MKNKTLILILALVLVQVSFADDDYKPYLHKASIPEHPELKLFGEYSTSLFPGAATYSYPIEVPKGVNDLQPSLAIMYNSQSKASSVVGYGWSLSSNFIYRDVNTTTGDTSDDEFVLVLDGTSYRLFSDGNYWHTEIESFLRIENNSNYWTLKKKDGISFRFGYNSSSRIDSSGYSTKWNLDLVEDTHSNKVKYSYSLDPNLEDTNALYLDKIEYGDVLLDLSYESNVRVDRRLIYDQGLAFEQSRRLEDISVFASDFVRRYHIDYVSLGPGISSVSSITYFGSDNSSSLPSVTFDYYLPSSSYNRSTYKPSFDFANANYDYGVRVLDVNNDGFVDIVQGNGAAGVKKVWLNDKVSNWSLSNWVLPEYIIEPDYSDGGVRLVDVNNDGFTDIIKSENGETRKVYLNNHTGWELSSWNLSEDIVDMTAQDEGVRFADVDGNGFVDLLKARFGDPFKVYLNNGTGWELSSWDIPINFSVSADYGSRLVDVNNDGYIDIIHSRAGDGRVWLNNGSGWWLSNYQLPVDFATESYTDNGVRIIDANGDGLVDLLENIHNNTEIYMRAYINNGTGWVQNDSWAGPEPFTKEGKNIGRRLADVNGDGFADIIASHEDNSTRFTWQRNLTLAYLLKSVVNEYGGVTLINYSRSTSLNNSEEGYSSFGFNIYVVSNVSSNNSLNVDSFTGYEYKYGKYDYYSQEFRGFEEVYENKSFSNLKHYFYQDDVLKGREYKTEIYDLNGSIASKSVKGISYSTLKGIHNVSLDYASDYLFDGGVRVLNKTFIYDNYGNLESVYDYGDVSILGDERVSNNSYKVDTLNWIIDKVSVSSLFDSSKVKETKYFYNEFGDLIEVNKWNNNGNNSISYFTYDNYGNVIKETDSLGNSQTYTYDSSLIYPSSIVNALGHISNFNYDLGTGNLNYEEKNDIRKTYEYDVFGRVVKEIMPYDSSSSPTKEYVYSFDGSVPSKVLVSLRTSGNNSQDVSYYYDGFANLIQIKTDVDSRQVVKNIFYDESYRVSSEQNPYFASYNSGLSNISNANYTYYDYDVLDRVVGVRNADGSVKNVTFGKYNVTDYDENSNKHVYTLDAHGRITRVYEYNTNDVEQNETYVTTYDYDSNDNLIKITDNEGNVFSFTYDSLSRKTAMDDPDLGSWMYKYDANGNLVSQTDARGEEIKLSYDALNRVVLKDSSDVDISFGYDKDYYGTLSNISSSYNFSYSYDDRLRVVEEVQEINGISFTNSFVYDSQDRIVSKNGIDYIFDKQGKIFEIPGFITSSSYNAFGSILNRSYANNLVQSFSYNSSNNRLVSINIPSVQSLSYTYDKVGNIMSITDVITGNNHILNYDNLDRLVNATIGSDVYKYSFDPLGRIQKIVKNTESKKFVYSKGHAPSTVITGDAGVDVYSVSSDDSKNKTFEFYLLGDNGNVNTNVTVDFGDGNSWSNNTITSNSKVSVQHNYTNGGRYLVNVSAVSSGIADWEVLDIKFGTKANDLELLNSDVSVQVFEFEMFNDMDSTAYNVGWNCSDGITSVYLTNLSSEEYLYDYIEHNYSTPGLKLFNCTATSDDGNDSKLIEFVVKGIEIENVSVSFVNGTTREVEFILANYWHPLDINWEISSKILNSTSLNTSDSVVIRKNITYSSDGEKVVKINVSSGGITNEHFETLVLEGVSIENYNVESNLTEKIIVFDVRNNWKDGNLTWAVDDPSLTDTVVLDYNESVMVVIENNYTEGVKKPEVTAIASSFIDTAKDYFEVRPLKILSLITLSEGSNAVSEMIVSNNLASMQEFNWQFDAGNDNVSSSLINITDDVFVYIESNYSSGVYRTNASVNSTNYKDSETGVVVI